MTKSPSKLFIFAGEKSGDLHGASFIRTWKEQLPNVSFYGVGGPDMRQEGLNTLLRMEQFEVMGFSDVLWSLPSLISHFRTVKKHILENNYDAILLIDYPGFNLRMASALRKAGYSGKIIQYISPSVWAHGKKRIPKMADTLDLLLTIYPFEPKCFAETQLDVRYIGHPIEDLVRTHHYQDQWSTFLGLPQGRPIVSLFPGSRAGEIRRNLPKQLEAASLYRKHNPETIFALSCAHDQVIPVMMKALESCDLKLNQHIFLVSNLYRYEMMRDSHSAIAKSGTVTLELALHECPTAVTYELTHFNYFILKYVLKLNLPHYCIVNILGQKEIYPELIDAGISVDALLQTLKQLDTETEKRQECIQGCQQVKKMLSGSSPSLAAVKAIRELLQC